MRRRRPFVVRASCAVLALSFALTASARAESAGRIISIAQRIAAQRQSSENATARAAVLDQKLETLRNEFFREEYRLISDRDSKLSELATEKELTREELAGGLFCSECKRGKSKIERQTKKPFEDHLSDVKGVAIPMTPAEIRKQMEAYDKQMADLEERANKQIRSLRERYESRSSSMIEQIVNVRVRAKMIELREGPKLAGQLAQAIFGYQAKNAQRDADWQQAWMEKILAQKNQTAIDLLKAEPLIERTRLALSIRIARGDHDEAQVLENRLQEAVESRRRNREQGDARAQHYQWDYQNTLAKRQRARGQEETRIVEALAEAGVGSYPPMGVQLSGAWSAPPSSALERTRLRTQEQLQEIRWQYEEAAEESRRELAGLSVLQDAAMRVGKWIERRPTVVRRNLGRIGDGFQRLRRWTRNDVVPTTVDNVILQVGTEGWLSVTPQALGPGVATDLAILTLRRWHMDEMRVALKGYEGGRLSQYEIDSLLREIDPDAGMHKWFLPHDPGLRKYLDGVYSITDEMKQKML
ncbi:MAG: cell division protein FtsB, partial [Planctomycetota bacterium]